MDKEILEYLCSLFSIDSNNIDLKIENFLITLCENFEDNIYNEHSKRYDELMESLFDIFDKSNNAIDDEEKEKLNNQEQQLIYEIFSLGYEQIFIIRLVSREK